VVGADVLLKPIPPINRSLPDAIPMSPLTPNLNAGAVVPIPTLPFALILRIDAPVHPATPVPVGAQFGLLRLFLRENTRRRGLNTWRPIP